MKPILRPAALALFAAALAVPALAQDGGSDKLATAQEKMGEMGENQATVKQLSDKANKTGDDDLIVCVLKKENAIDALIGVSNIAMDDLKKALAAQQDARADHELRKILVASSRVSQFTTESYECFPDQEVASDENIVNAEDFVAEDETDDSGDGEGDVGWDPPSTTPFE